METHGFNLNLDDFPFDEMVEDNPFNMTIGVCDHIIGNTRDLKYLSFSRHNMGTRYRMDSKFHPENCKIRFEGFGDSITHFMAMMGKVLKIYDDMVDHFKLHDFLVLPLLPRGLSTIELEIEKHIRVDGSNLMIVKARLERIDSWEKMDQMIGICNGH